MDLNQCIFMFVFVGQTINRLVYSNWLILDLLLLCLFLFMHLCKMYTLVIKYVVKNISGGAGEFEQLFFWSDDNNGAT